MRNLHFRCMFVSMNLRMHVFCMHVDMYICRQTCMIQYVRIYVCMYQLRGGLVTTPSQYKLTFGVVVDGSTLPLSTNQLTYGGGGCFHLHIKSPLRW